MRPLIDFEESIGVIEAIEALRAKAEAIVSDTAPCEAAEQFEAWCGEELARLGEQPRLIDVQRSKLFLLDRYFAWRVRVGDACRDHAVRDEHRCIFQVFEDAYLALDKLELALHPPLQPPEAERPMVAVPGVMLGDDVYEPQRPA
jgi:hypothetical protein